MDQTILLALVGAALVGLAALALIVRGEREATASAQESPYGVSTEGMKVCPRCGRGNLWTDAVCLYCRSKLV